MGGPIVRTGTTPAFWNNWEKAFGKKTKSGSTSAKTDEKKSAGAKGGAKKTKKAAKPKGKK
jgi:hypothetical protein